MNESYMQLTRNLHRVIHSYYIIVRNLITERFVLNLRILELVSDKLIAVPYIVSHVNMKFNAKLRENNLFIPNNFCAFCVRFWNYVSIPTPKVWSKCKYSL